ncbi:MAG: alpha/beta fold hydrolase [Lentisphaeria bacterium]|nr:alpha/beta fold hydrolase [Lentisphaeria bacterium]
MPVIVHSSYHPPRFLTNSHLQTILPSYIRRGENVEYEREHFTTPDDDVLLLDWSRCGRASDRLLIINHGLCGHSRRHYVLSLVKAFNDIGWDCLAWNYRGTGLSEGVQLQFATNDSTHELDWVTRHAIAAGGYRKVAFSGYSMGGNLCLLYLGRHAAELPPEIVGAAVFCAAIDLSASSQMFNTAIGRLYARHFLQKLLQMMVRKHEQFPELVDISDLESVTTMDEFDERFTAPLMGYADAEDYWRKASASRWLDKIRVPTLMVNPRNDPFLAGDCYPVKAAEENPHLFLEMPDGGGHCGFITPGLDREWWPAFRAKEFLGRLV